MMGELKMTGIEKIIAKIREDAIETSNKILDDAKSEADAIFLEAEIEAEKKEKEIIENAQNNAKSIISMAESSSKMEYRDILLKERANLIESIINGAKEKILNLGDKEYFDRLLKLAKKYAHKGEGEIIFSKKDLSRLPSDFIARVNAEIKANGARLVLSDESRDIEGGFILKYDNIEENCTISAIIKQMADELRDKINEKIASLTN